MKKIYAVITKVESTVAKVLMIAIIAVVFAAAMSRTFGFSLPWSQDFVLLLFAWFTWFAASQASRKKKHVGVDILTMHLPQKVQLFLQAFCHGLAAAFMLVIAFGAVKFTINNRMRQITSLGISYSWITVTVAIGGILMSISEILYCVTGFIDLYKGGVKE